MMRFDFEPEPRPGPWTRRLCVAAVIVIALLPAAFSAAVIFSNGR